MKKEEGNSHDDSLPRSLSRRSQGAVESPSESVAPKKRAPQQERIHRQDGALRFTATRTLHSQPFWITLTI